MALDLALEEMDLLSALAASLPPAARGEFLEQVGARLAGVSADALGPGLLHRVASQVQRDFLNVAVGPGGRRLYGRRG